VSDSSASAGCGATVPGRLTLVSGQTHGAIASQPTPAVANGTVISTGGEAAKYEDCSPPDVARIEMTGRNIGNLLNAEGVSWGWFSCGFRPTSRTADGTAVCASAHANVGGVVQTHYYSGGWIEPFHYYQSTANPHPPAPA